MKSKKKNFVYLELGKIGLNDTSTTFQSMMNHIFYPLLGRCVLVFFDDILVYRPNVETHVKHLDMVLNKLRDNKLFANQKQCDLYESPFNIWKIGFLNKE